jgi:hypothetical protein
MPVLQMGLSGDDEQGVMHLQSRAKIRQLARTGFHQQLAMSSITAAESPALRRDRREVQIRALWNGQPRREHLAED